MKKILSLTLAAAALSTAADAKAFNGLFAGVDFGLSSMNVNFKGVSADRQAKVSLLIDKPLTISAVLRIDLTWEFFLGITKCLLTVLP